MKLGFESTISDEAGGLYSGELRRIGYGQSIQLCASLKHRTLVSQTHSRQVIGCKSASHHGNMGDLYEHHSAHSFCTPCTSMRSCPQARQFADPVDSVQLDTAEQLTVDPCRKFHRAMLQVVDKTLGVSFCESCRKRLVHLMLHNSILMLLLCLCSQQSAKLAPLHACCHWGGFFE